MTLLCSSRNDKLIRGSDQGAHEFISDGSRLRDLLATGALLLAQPRHVLNLMAFRRRYNGCRSASLLQAPEKFSR